MGLRSKTSNKKYFEFLSGIVLEGGQNNVSRTFLWTLYDVDFRWSVPNDDNRGVDGLALRDEFGEKEVLSDADWVTIKESPCSVLEVLIGVAKRAEFELDRDDEINFIPSFFWEMILNLKLEIWSDGYPDWKFMDEDNRRRLDKWLDRRFGKYGQGSIFPLKRLRVNMRETEIWYQMMMYLQENYPGSCYTHVSKV